MKKVAIIGTNPSFLGGIAVYENQVLSMLKKQKDLQLYVIYSGNKNKRYASKGVNFMEVKVNQIYPFDQISFNSKVAKIIRTEKFEIINSHAVWGAWVTRLSGRNTAQTYHGVTYYFLKNHYSRLNVLKKIALMPMLVYARLIERPPYMNAEKVICVSEKVKRDLESLYGSRKNIYVIRTSADLNTFKKMNSRECRKKLGLEIDRIYGLYVGRGGYWTKGLDRAIKLSEEMYKLDKNYRLIVGGADKSKTKEFLQKPFVIYKEIISREEMPAYYNSADFFFCLSRYEGGAPTLVTAEAMACGCLVVCSKDSEQEVIVDGKNGFIIDLYSQVEAEKVLRVTKNSKIKKKIVSNSVKSIRELSFDKWGKEYSKVLLGE